MSYKLKVIGIIGPSGSGKSTIAKKLTAIDSNLKILPTYTDRPKRPNEKDYNHIFVSTKRFDKLLTDDKFLVTSRPFGMPYRYGFAAPVDKNPIYLLIFRSFLLTEFRSFFPNSLVLQIIADQDNVKKYMLSRGDNNLDILKRLESYRSEVLLGKKHEIETFYHNFHNTNDLAQELYVKILNDK